MSQSVDARIARLRRGVADLLTELERAPDDALYQPPSPGEWPVMSTLAHVAELMPYWARQAQAIASAPGAPFGRTHADADRLGAIDQHGRDRKADMLPRLQASLEQAVSILEALPADAWGRTGQHPTRGSMSVEQVVESFLLAHVEEHTAQLRATLRALQSARA